VGATYVVVDNLEDALTYFGAGLLYWSIGGDNAEWFSQHDSRIDGRTPPTPDEVTHKFWAILVEEEEC